MSQVCIWPCGLAGDRRCCVNFGGGIVVSPGTGAGLVYRLAPRPLPDQPRASTDAEADVSRAVLALEQVALELERRAANAIATAADVLNAEALIARDPTVADTVSDRIRHGVGAAWAVDGALREQ
jgi:phosphoenolpyruvate-protein phosphotransferase (PTS system enzyme I)